MPRGISGKELNKAVSVNLSIDSYRKIYKIIKDFKFNNTVSEFIRIAVENQLRTISKKTNTYRIVEYEGKDFIEVENICPHCNNTSILYINSPTNLVDEEEYKATKKKLKELFKNKFSDEEN